MGRRNLGKPVDPNKLTDVVAMEDGYVQAVYDGSSGEKVVSVHNASGSEDHYVVDEVEVDLDQRVKKTERVGKVALRRVRG